MKIYYGYILNITNKETFFETNELKGKALLTYRAVYTAQYNRKAKNISPVLLQMTYTNLDLDLNP